MAINIKMRALKQSNEQYKFICEGYNRNKADCAINTEDILEPAREMVFVDQSVGHEIKIEEDEIKIEDDVGEEQGHEIKVGEEQGHEIKIEDSP